MSTNSTALIIFAHGSPVESANEAVRVVSRSMAAQSVYPVKEAYLDGGKPDLRGAVEELAAQGATRIIVIPYFLTLGLHLQRDLPKLVQEAAAAHPGVNIDVTPPLDGHPALVEILLDRAAAQTNGTKT